MVPTYGSNKVRRYAYYETRKDLTGSRSAPGVRLRRGQLDEHLIGHLEQLLKDEDALRHLSCIEEANQLRNLFATAQRLAVQLREMDKVDTAVRVLIVSVTVETDRIDISLNANALNPAADGIWRWKIPLPARRPFREVRLRIDTAAVAGRDNEPLLRLLADAFEALKMVQASPGLSLNQIAQKEGRCRTQLGRLLRIAWLSPRIVEAIAAGKEPPSLSRKRLLTTDMPIDWVEQERLLGFAA
jgi:hypothetical protein